MRDNSKKAEQHSLMTENIEGYKLDTPKYWNITKILESKGYKVNALTNYKRLTRRNVAITANGTV
jgi:hypothetical protein